MVAVGASGAALKLSIDPTTPTTLLGTWIRPDCVPRADCLPMPDCAGRPDPLDSQLVLTSVAERDGVFQLVGAAGTYATLNPSAGRCGITSLATGSGLPPTFLTSIFPLNGDHAYAIGDNGIFVELNGRGPCTPTPTGPVAVITTDLPRNLNALWVTRVNGAEFVWLVGATGTVVRAGCY